MKAKWKRWPDYGMYAGSWVDEDGRQHDVYLCRPDGLGECAVLDRWGDHPADYSSWNSNAFRQVLEAFVNQKVGGWEGAPVSTRHRMSEIAGVLVVACYKAMRDLRIEWGRNDGPLVPPIRLGE